MCRRNSLQLVATIGNSRVDLAPQAEIDRGSGCAVRPRGSAGLCVPGTVLRLDDGPAAAASPKRSGPGLPPGPDRPHAEPLGAEVRQRGPSGGSRTGVVTALRQRVLRGAHGKWTMAA
ncbi:hypothetical protein GCM10027174_40500 [Salinifilum aidingensis]